MEEVPSPAGAEEEVPGEASVPEITTSFMVKYIGSPLFSYSR